MVSLKGYIGLYRGYLGVIPGYYSHDCNLGFRVKGLKDLKVRLLGLLACGLGVTDLSRLSGLAVDG